MVELRTNIENTLVFFRWMQVFHPEILDEYFKSETYKALTKTNKSESIKDALKTLKDVE